MRRYTMLVVDIAQRFQDLRLNGVNRASRQERDTRRFDDTAHYRSDALFPTLTSNFISTKLELPVPSSDRVLSNIIKRLKDEKATDILLTVAKDLP